MEHHFLDSEQTTGCTMHTSLKTEAEHTSYK